MKKYCWEIQNCGREPGGPNAEEKGVCPVFECVKQAEHHQIAILRHEISQPLTAITNYVNGCIARLQAANKCCELTPVLQLVLEQIERIKHILPSFSGLIYNEPTKHAPIHLEALFKQTQKRVEEAFLPETICCKFTCAKNAAHILGDGCQLEQLFFNLIRNATEAIQNSKHTAKGKIEITASKPDEETILIEVIDNGPGISSELHHTIFEPYFSTKDNHFGVGLPLCRAIMKSHGGDLNIDPTRAHGTRFILTFPINPKKKASQPTPCEAN